jgi:AcrR family transcriptional regulator
MRALAKEKGTRKPRVDAVRNRERVLEAAKTVFSAGGPDASLEAVARAAGVGIGTLYRHFPTREALFEAVYRREVQQLADLAEELKQQTQPVDALRQWMRAIVTFVATKKGMSAALAYAADKNSELISYSSDRLERSQQAKSAATSAPKICCVLSSACATCMISLAGRPACSASSTFSSTVCVSGAIQSPKLYSSS